MRSTSRTEIPEWIAEFHGRKWRVASQTRNEAYKILRKIVKSHYDKTVPKNASLVRDNSLLQGQINGE